MLQSMSNKIK